MAKSSVLNEKKRNIAGSNDAKVSQILTDKQLSNLRTILGKRHAIDLLFALYLDKARHKNIETFFSEFGISISDGVFYARLNSFVKAGLAKIIKIDSLRKYYVISDYGEKIAELLLRFFDELDTMLSIS